MSVEALNAAFKRSRADGAAFTVLLAMADWADQNGRCYPSYGQIAKKARVSRGTVALAIQKLVDLGEVERVTHGRAPDVDDDEAPSKVRTQWRNTYKISLIRSKRQVVQPSDGLPTDEVVRESGDHTAQVVQLSGDQSRQFGDPAQVVRQSDGHASSSVDRGSPIDVAQVVRLTDPHPYSPSGRPSEEPRAGSPTPPAPESPETNLNVITKIAHESIDLCGLSDLPEVVKSRCASLHIAYDSGVVRKAIESAQWQRRRRQAGL